MKSQNVRATVAAPIVLFAALSCAAWGLQTGTSVMLDGAAVTTDVRMINGRAYVPMADVAHAMGLQLVKRSGSYQLARTESPASRAKGGVGAIGGVAGKLDTEIASGPWSLRVLSVAQVASYSDRFGPGTDPVALQQAGDVLIAVRCRLRNRTNTAQDVYFDQGSAGNTSLTDRTEHAYPPAAIDSRNSDYSTNRMFPGTVQEFTLVFSVPRDTQMKDLVYTVATSGAETKTNFRIALTP